MIYTRFRFSRLTAPWRISVPLLHLGIDLAGFLIPARGPAGIRACSIRPSLRTSQPVVHGWAVSKSHELEFGFGLASVCRGAMSFLLISAKYFAYAHHDHWGFSPPGIALGLYIRQAGELKLYLLLNCIVRHCAARLFFFLSRRVSFLRSTSDDGVMRLSFYTFLNSPLSVSRLAPVQVHLTAFARG